MVGKARSVDVESALHSKEEALEDHFAGSWAHHVIIVHGLAKDKHVRVLDVTGDLRLDYFLIPFEQFAEVEHRLLNLLEVLPLVRELELLQHTGCNRK